MKFLPQRILEAFNGDKDEAVRALAQQESIWTCGFDAFGKFKGKGKVSMTDAVALPNASILVPHVLTKFVKEGIEPMLIGERLLTQIQYQPGLSIQFPAIGALYAEDVAPGSSLPEFAPDIAGHTTNEMRVGKSGLALKVFDEIIGNSQYNLVAYWLRMAGAALARHKEQKIFNYINSMGTVAFDNETRSNGITGKYTSGRKADGTLNGSMTMDDLFEMYTIGLQQGFIMDTILVHPLTWLMWLRDPVLRTFQLQYGGGAWFNMWQGDPRNRDDLAFFDPLGDQGTGQFVNPPQYSSNADGPETATAIEEWDQRLTSRPTPPNYLGLSFNFMVSPFVPFDPDTNTATVMMFNAGNLGALIVDEAPRVQEWKMPEHELTKMQIYEKYGIAILNEGQAIVTAQNVKVDRNYIADESIMPTASVSLPSGLVDPAQSGLDSPIS